MSAFDLSWHIAASESRFMRTLPAGEFYLGPIEKPKTMDEIVHVYVENFKRDLAAIKGLSGEQLAKVIDFRGMFQLPAVAYLNFSMGHIIHHRGQLLVYLRPMGAKVPSIYGESYDDAQMRLAAVANSVAPGPTAPIHSSWSWFSLSAITRNSGSPVTKGS